MKKSAGIPVETQEANVHHILKGIPEGSHKRTTEVFSEISGPGYPWRSGISSGAC